MEVIINFFEIVGMFVRQPPVLYPNLTLEANIVIQRKENALTLPRAFIVNENQVITSAGDTLIVQLGIKDYQKAEIISGLDEKTEVKRPAR